jgi:hypothetical protein
MNPRLTTSRKWTAFPTEYIEQIRQVFQDHFQGQWVVDGRIYSEEILLRVGRQKPGQLAQDNIEVSVDFYSSEENGQECIDALIDAAATLMTDFLAQKEQDAEETPEFPLYWTEMEQGKFKIYFQYSGENSDLAAQADAILGLSEGQLFNEQPEGEDALDHAQTEEFEKLQARIKEMQEHSH